MNNDGSSAQRRKSDIASKTQLHHKLSKHPSTDESPTHKGKKTPRRVMHSMANIHPRNARIQKAWVVESPPKQAFRPYFGDMFSTRGEYVDGILYMSRMKSELKRHLDLGPIEETPSASRSQVRQLLHSDINGGMTGRQKSNSVEEADALTSSSPCDNNDELNQPNEATQELQLREQCARTLSNWSRNVENARLMIEEGVVNSLAHLSHPYDEHTCLHCVTTMHNLSEVVELRNRIVQQGGVKTIVEIWSNTVKDEYLEFLCALTLSNFCSNMGEEERIVTDGAVGALASHGTHRPQLAMVCYSALFNLTYAREVYNRMEIVLKMFMTMVSPSHTNARRAIASNLGADDLILQALCNLSNHAAMRSRLIEEGILTSISSFIRPSMPANQHLIAYILLNLSSSKACRLDMMTRGAMKMILVVANAAHEPDTKNMLAQVLYHLSKPYENQNRMIMEGLLVIIKELCCKHDEGEDDGSDTAKVCVRILYTLSASSVCRPRLVERGVVNILATLSEKLAPSNSIQLCTLALCNFLSEEQAGMDIVQTGAITSLFALCQAPNHSLATKLLFARSLHGICSNPKTQVSVSSDEVIQALLPLMNMDADNLGVAEARAGAKKNVPVTESTRTVQAREPELKSAIRQHCVAALALLAFDTDTIQSIDDTIALDSVIAVMKAEYSNEAIHQLCCTFFSLLAYHEQHANMLARTAIDAMLERCLETSNVMSKKYCCHVIASMSCHQSCCSVLLEAGSLAVLSRMVHQHKSDAFILRLCSIALVNMSSASSLCQSLLSSGALFILSGLSNSYSEDIQNDCSKVLCHLSNLKEQEDRLVGEGTLGVLFMIAMVRAVSSETKEICLRSLVNLLVPSTVDKMIQEGTVKMLPMLSTASSQRSGDTALRLFCKLFAFETGRKAVCADYPPLKSLLDLLKAPPVTSKIAALQETLLSELVFYQDTRSRSVSAGLVEVLCAAIARIREQESEDSGCAARGLTLAFFVLVRDIHTKVATASTDNVQTVAGLLDGHEEKEECRGSLCALYAISSICVLAWHDETRAMIDFTTVLPLMVSYIARQSMLFQTEDASPVKVTMLALCCLAQEDKYQDDVIASSLIHHLHEEFMKKEVAMDRTVLGLVCNLFRQISHAPTFATVVNSDNLPIIHSLWCMLVQTASSCDDLASCLDCADILCSLAFAGASMRKMPDDAFQSHRIDKVNSQLVSKKSFDCIQALMTSEQHLETRLCCITSIWMLASYSDNAKALVHLGATQLVVEETRRLDSRNHDTIRFYCAGALNSFASNDMDSISAQRMIQDGAVPALVALAKRDDNVIRDRCARALSYLSAQSPKLEIGAVMTVLCASNLNDSSLLSSTPTRPLILLTNRHKELVQLPNFDMELRPRLAWMSLKCPGNFDISRPPVPALPPAASTNGSEDDYLLDSGGGNASASRQSRYKRSQSLPGKNMKVIPSLDDDITNTTGASASDSGRRRQYIAFPKLDSSTPDIRKPQPDTLKLQRKQGVQDSSADSGLTNKSRDEANEDKFGVADSSSKSRRISQNHNSRLSSSKILLSRSLDSQSSDKSGQSKLSRLGRSKTSSTRSLAPLKNLSSRSTTLSSLQETKSTSQSAAAIKTTRSKKTMSRAASMEKLEGAVTLAAVAASFSLYKQAPIKPEIQQELVGSTDDDRVPQTMLRTRSLEMLASTFAQLQSRER